MKKLFQNVNTGETLITEVPRPQCKKGHVLIKTSISLISSGTERMLVDFGKSNYLDKARKQPEKVKMVLDKIKTDGLVPTVEAVKSKLDQPLPMGYSNIGSVIEVGEGVTDLKIGDRVVSNGSHAEIVCVPENLVAIIPKNLSNDDASFTVIGSIALQGIRLAEPTIGETFVVMGLGLIGLLTVQILKANGCKVLGLDFNAERLKLAESYGIQTLLLGDNGADPILVADRFSKNKGVDGVIITASTESNEPIHNAATMCRKNGRIILVGVVGLDLQRNDFYEKEISFRVSCSYGPGRYDSFYEEEGNDYPIGYVRWTEKRNFEAVLDLFTSRSVRLDQLKSKYFNFEEASRAYETLLEDKSVLGILLKYNDSINESQTTLISSTKKTKLINYTETKPVIGVIGAGNHAGRTLIPGFSKTSARLKSIASSQGISGTHYGKKFGFEITTTDTESIFSDDEINTIIIATQHNTHCQLVISSLKHNKNVFVEKPLALNDNELDRIEEAYNKSIADDQSLQLMVGFNRRFSPLVQKLKTAVNNSEPMSIIYTCNSGYIPEDSWVHDITMGGGRIIGEACHFIDICRFLTNSKIMSISSHKMVSSNNLNDVVSINLSFENGSLATIHYFSNGDKSYPKERLEVFQSGGVAVIDNYKSLKSYGFRGLSGKTLLSQNKGINECTRAFIETIENGNEPLITFEEIIEVSRASILASKQLLKN